MAPTVSRWPEQVPCRFSVYALIYFGIGEWEFSNSRSRLKGKLDQLTFAVSYRPPRSTHVFEDTISGFAVSIRVDVIVFTQDIENLLVVHVLELDCTPVPEYGLCTCLDIAGVRG